MSDDVDPAAGTLAEQDALGDTLTAPHREMSVRGDTGLQAGDRLGRYEIVERIGAGGMGAVYRARDPELSRIVAIKLLHTGPRDNGDRADLQERLKREARAMARLSHANLVTVFDVGTANDRVFVAMEYVAGETLRSWLDGDHDWRDTIELLVQAGRGLAVAHEAGVIHRDFKPDNVLVSSTGTAQVADFGLSRSIGESELRTGDGTNQGSDVRLTQTGAVMGTPAYMAPEQHDAMSTDARTDQFSFAVTAYEALYKSRPFSGNTITTLAGALRRGEIRRPPPDTDVPAGVFAALSRAMATDPDERWPSMEALLGALSSCVRTESSGPARSGARLVLIGAATAVVAAGLVLWIASLEGDEPGVPTRQRSAAGEVAQGSASSTGLAGVDIDAAAIELPETMGNRANPREVIRKVARHHRLDIQRCYEAELSEHPVLRGTVAIHFEIGASGHVIATRVAQTDFPELAIGSCIAARAAMWKFPKPDDGETITAVYPFSFGPPLTGQVERVANEQFRVPRAVVDQALASPVLVVEGAQLVAVLGEHDMAGARIAALEESALLYELGLRRGDTVATINGVRVTASVSELVEAVAEREQIVVGYYRVRGTPRQLTIRVE